MIKRIVSHDDKDTRNFHLLESIDILIDLNIIFMFCIIKIKVFVNEQ